MRAHNWTMIVIVELSFIEFVSEPKITRSKINKNDTLENMNAKHLIEIIIITCWKWTLAENDHESCCLLIPTLPAI